VRLFVALFLLVVATVCTLAATRFLGVAIDAIRDNESSSINRIGIVLVALTATAGVFGYLGRYQLAKAVETTLARFRVEAFTAAVHLRLDTVEQVGTADPLTRLTGDVGSVTDVAHDLLPSAVMAALTLLLTMVALFFTAPLLGVAALTMVPLIIVVCMYYLRRASPVYLDEQRSYARVARTVHEISDGAATIRTYRQQDQWTAQMHASLDNQWIASWPPSILRIVLFPGTIIATFIGLFCVLLVGNHLYASGRASLGTVSAAALYVVQLAPPIAMVLDSLNQVQQALASLMRIAGISEAIKDDPGTPTALPADGSIDVRDVHFSYGDGAEILHGISLRIESGERVAVVGPSGAGKSTIAKLISGIHEARSGSVTVGGVAVADIARTSERRCIALVTQESHVFLGTIAGNCRLGKADASDAEIRHALDTVQALTWIEDLPDGVNTDVGPAGVRLTLVQAQQVALARVVLANPLVVILDEATAGLGSDSARGIEQAFAAVLAGRTVVTIAHRLDVAMTSDRVIVVEHGTVITGTHEELLATAPVYARLWSHWR
jgi:ABC-type multidrug transport system fused ATPase/permease subunit